MRVTICCKRFGQRGGAEAFLINCARYLVSEGHQVRALAQQPDGEVEGIELARLNVPPAPRAFQDLALARAAEKALAAEDADVTFSDQRCWGAQVVRLGGGVQREFVRQRARSYRTPLGRAANALARRLSVRERLRLSIEARMYRHPALRRIIANSDMVRRELERHFPHVADRVRVVYNGADPERFSPELKRKHCPAVRQELGIPSDAFVGVFVGHDWRRKGLFTFLEALALLARKPTPRPVYALVVGRGNARRAHAFARRRGVAHLVRFTGDREPDAFYGASDVLVLPSYYDPCANVTMEALACGLPAITSAHNGAYELLTPGGNGFYMEDASDAERLAGFIEHFMDEGRLAAASEAARRLALRYTLSGQYAKVLEVLQEAAELPPRRDG